MSGISAVLLVSCTPTHSFKYFTDLTYLSLSDFLNSACNTLLSINSNDQFSSVMQKQYDYANFVLIVVADDN